MFERIAQDPACDYCSGRKRPGRIDVDDVYCILLVEQPHRTAYATAHFHAVGLCRQVVLYFAKRNDAWPGLGVWTSHQEVAREARRRGQSRVLILENDVAFTDSIEHLAPRIARALARLPRDWQALYLGHIPVQAYFAGWGLLRVRSACTHAYIANAPLLAWLADTTPRSPELAMWPMIRPSIDSALSNLPGMYAVFPMMAMQKDLRDNRIDSKFRLDGQRRSWRDFDRWRHHVLFRGARITEWAAALASPFHWLTMDFFRRRVQAQSADARRIREAGLFDDAFYLQTYPDVARAGVHPFAHYLEFGFREGRWPNATFDPQYYAKHAPTYRRGENPLLHYLSTGRQAGYPTHRPPAAETADRSMTA